MPSSSSSSTKRRAQGGGRKANSEPRLQVFKEFGGCNFELSPRDFTLGKTVDQEQADLQMNYVVVQNNAGIASNKTIETRNNLVKLFSITSGSLKFTDACVFIGNELFIGMSDGTLRSYAMSDPTSPETVRAIYYSDTQPGHHWTSLAYVDGKLVGTTSEHQLWTGDLDSYTISNARKIPDPSAPTFYQLAGMGDLEIRQTQDNDHPYRIAIAYTLVNKFGPTKCSPQLTFYANHPVDEWHSNRYLYVSVHPPSGYFNSGVMAAEFYYSTGNSSELLFAGRTDRKVATLQIGGNDSNAFEFEFNWYGYLDATSMWPVANLIAPTENYTEGPRASRTKCIDGRMYFWGDGYEPQRLYIGGNSGNLFSISPGTGGGFVDTEPDTGFGAIRVVDKYKTQSGASIVTMLCDSPNSSKSYRYNLVENSVALSSEQSMKSWQAEQVAGAVGCKSYHGAIVCEDGLYAVNPYGLALTTMTMEYNSQIRVNYVSDPVKPAFTNQYSDAMKSASLLEVDGVLYMAFGKEGDGNLDNMLFCYDIDQKAWWTITLDLDEPILCLFNVDHEGSREGIGIVTDKNVYMLPLTHGDPPTLAANFPVTIQTGELSTQQPQQGWSYISQLEFRFDYFIGTVLVELTGIDQFGRKVSTKKHISHSTVAYDLAEYMRVDLRLQSYQVRITGTARFRLTHFIAKLYTMSSKQGLVWGFDDSQSYRTSGDIHPTFLDYNDIKKAIIP